MFFASSLPASPALHPRSLLNNSDLLAAAERLRHLPFWIFFTAFVSFSAVAQISTGSIVGTVKDKQALVVSGAEVEITNQGTDANYVTVTNGSGTFQIDHIAAGVYRVQVSKVGFRTAIIGDIKLDAGTDYSVPPIILEIGSRNEMIEVSAGEQLVQTTSAAVSETVEKKQLDELPLQDRNPLVVTLLQPGTSGILQSDLSVNPPSNTAINGQRTSFSNMTLDGINIQDNFIRENDLDFTPNNLLLGQVTEVTVTTQNGGPETGLGSSQVNLVTPSGTNTLHGEVFWYHRNSYQAANDWFSNHDGVPRPHFLLNQSGGSIGGPIRRNKLFVYGAYELYDNPLHTPWSRTILLPGAAEGVFRYHTDCTPQNCPAGVSPGQVVQTDLFSMRCAKAAYLCSTDSVIAAQIARLPTIPNDPTQGDGLNTSGFKLNRRNNGRLDNASTRFDYILSLHHSFASTFAWNRAYFDRPDVDSTFNVVPSVVNRDTIKFLSTSWRWSPRTALTNEVRFGFDVAPAFFKGGVNVYTQPYVLGGTIYTNPDQSFFFQGRNTRTFSWQDNARWSRGSHAFSFGGLVQRIFTGTINQNNVIPVYGLGFSQFDVDQLSQGDFSCNGCSGPISQNDLNTANSLLSTLTGNIGSVSQQFNVTGRASGFVRKAPQIGDYTLNDYAFYAGDSWRLHRSFTVNLGLRWEYFGRFNEQHGLLIGPVVPVGQTAEQAMLGNATADYLGGQSGRQVYAKDLDNFAPQVGFAWDPWGNGKTAIRAGFSMHYSNDESIRADNNATSVMPGLSTNITNSFLVGNTISDNPPSLATPPNQQIPYRFRDQWLQTCAAAANTQPSTLNCTNAMDQSNFGFLVNPSLQTPYVQEWNFSIQRNLGWETSLTLSYLGNRANRLYKGIDYNQVDIRQNGILADFLRARSNAFLSQAAGKGFNPDYNANVPGSQPLTVFSQLEGPDLGCDPGLLACAPPITSLVATGEVGELANIEHILYMNYLNGSTFPWTPNPFIVGGDYLTNAAYSDWNAGTVEIRRRSRQGLYLQANYTFSKVITNGDGISQPRFDPFLDNAQPGLDKRRADIDLTHAFKTNFIYELPIGRGHSLHSGNAVLSGIISGWNVGTIMVWQSGFPFSITSGRGTLNRAGRSGGKNTADSKLTVSEISQHLGVFDRNGAIYGINPEFIGPDKRGIPTDALSCTPLVVGGFCNPAPGTAGNLPRDAFSGPDFYDWDFSIAKKTTIAESRYLEFQAEFFNLPNHPTFLIGDMGVNSTQFGVISGTATTARRVQFGLKLAF